MNLPAIDQKLALGVGGLALVGVLLYLFAKREAKQAAAAAGGLISGNNAITSGTVYEGAGVLGTLGASANAASGGLLENIGSWIGGKVFDLTHSEEKTDNAFTPRSVQVREEASYFDLLLGSTAQTLDK